MAADIASARPSTSLSKAPAPAPATAPATATPVPSRVPTPVSSAQSSRRSSRPPTPPLTPFNADQAKALPEYRALTRPQKILLGAKFQEYQATHNGEFPSIERVQFMIGVIASQHAGSSSQGAGSSSQSAAIQAANIVATGQHEAHEEDEETPAVVVPTTGILGSALNTFRGYFDPVPTVEPPD
jgi:hypothetical protein